jgi:hypothetical protein
MFLPTQGDLLIRSQSVEDGSHAFLVAEAKTTRVLAGPFETLRDAIIAAARLARGQSIWHETLDDRGRRIGEPVRLPFRSRPQLSSV